MLYLDGMVIIGHRSFKRIFGANKHHNNCESCQSQVTWKKSLNVSLSRPVLSRPEIWLTF